MSAYYSDEIANKVKATLEELVHEAYRRGWCEGRSALRAAIAGAMARGNQQDADHMPAISPLVAEPVVLKSIKAAPASIKDGAFGRMTVEQTERFIEACVRGAKYDELQEISGYPKGSLTRLKHQLEDRIRRVRVQQSEVRRDRVPIAREPEIKKRRGGRQTEMWPPFKETELLRLRVDEHLTFYEIAQRLGPGYTRAMCQAKAARIGLPTAPFPRVPKVRVAEVVAAETALSQGEIEELAEQPDEAGGFGPVEPVPAISEPSFEAYEPAKQVQVPIPLTLYDVIAWYRRRDNMVTPRIGGGYTVNGKDVATDEELIRKVNVQRGAAGLPLFVDVELPQVPIAAE